MVELKESVTNTSWSDSLHRWESAISPGSKKPQTETVGAHQCTKPGVSSRQRCVKPQTRDSASRKSEQYPDHPQPKPSHVQNASESAHQESDSTVTNQHVRTDHLPSQNPRLQGIGHHHHHHHLHLLYLRTTLPDRQARMDYQLSEIKLTPSFTHTHTHKYARTHARAHTHTHTYTHAHTHTHEHTYIDISRRLDVLTMPTLYCIIIVFIITLLAREKKYRVEASTKSLFLLVFAQI